MNNRSNTILTILICCYNAEDFLPQCLSSLSNQNISNSFYKILFINDASTDNSLKTAKKYSSTLTNFNLLNNKRNIGLVPCCNNALKIIDTPYFMRLDADDYLSSDAFEKIYKELKSLNNQDLIIFNRWDVYDSKLEKISVQKDIYTWIATGVVFKTDDVRAVGGYSAEYWEEYDLFIKLLEGGAKYKLSSNRIYYYRRNHGSMTQSSEENKRGFERLITKWGVKVLKKYGNFKNITKYYKGL